MREEYQYEEPDDWTQEELEMEAAAKKSQVGYLTLHTYTLNADPVPTGSYLSDHCTLGKSTEIILIMRFLS